MRFTEKSLKKWEVSIVDAGDGSGDCYVQFPSELLKKLDWHEGDVINIDIVNDQLLLTKLNG
ncbi:AbrB/MazE/SpoVT family DNA-binding domain-containing protein [Undibacterium baiyunense]|uniref:AbrB/MazE/SpoVT family DNA-binding domain-containing protein n=1 Tax=Undibacterium baiyunense TaxID=2828731 RepID=A0A941I1S6_9BURK|nr:AbrB/MazE/SpoVT family DNA-binding domain-containing protein [Undibacterium baiyunense]MBR7745220.1 AbrB/MazE/SpoVT family DNA-binding domain-containing protein [Undibacterium baiyunense]